MPLDNENHPRNNSTRENRRSTSGIFMTDHTKPRWGRGYRGVAGSSGTSDRSKHNAPTAVGIAYANSNRSGWALNC